MFDFDTVLAQTSFLNMLLQFKHKNREFIFKSIVIFLLNSLAQEHLVNYN